MSIEVDKSGGRRNRATIKDQIPVHEQRLNRAADDCEVVQWIAVDYRDVGDLAWRNRP